MVGTEAHTQEMREMGGQAVGLRDSGIYPESSGTSVKRTRQESVS